MSSDHDISDTFRPIRYWVNDAHKSEAACALAQSIGLSFPCGEPVGFQAGLLYPIRRLVITGKDTPDNFNLLFSVDDIPDLHAQVRKEVLMMAEIPQQSPSGLLNSYLDKDCPVFAPRPASDAEKQEIEKQRELSVVFQRFLNSANQDV